MEWEVGGVEDEEDFDQIHCEEDSVSEEAKPPEVLRDPGAPTPQEVDEPKELVPTLRQRQGAGQVPQEAGGPE